MLVAAVSHALSNKKMAEIVTNFGRMPLEMHRRTHLPRKLRNKFFEISDFRKNIVNSLHRQMIKF